MNIAKVSFNEFEKNNVAVYVGNEKESELFYKWLKFHNYKYLGSNKHKKSTNGNFMCYNGWYCGMNNLINEKQGKLITVYDLTLDDVKVKEMTVEQVIKELGYDIKIVK